MINIFFVLIILVIISILIYFFLKKKILLIVQLFAKIFHLGEHFFLFKLLNKNLIISSKNLLIKNNLKIAIIIQGPIVDQSNFTIETINFYLHNYPFIPIIVSTWEGDEKKLKKIFKKEINKKIYLILNKIPKYSGYKNINLQAVSTKMQLTLQKN